MKNSRGLSLIEILVALIITGIIAACVSAAVIGGYYMLKQAEHKSRAMSISHVKLQEYLAKSFSQLPVSKTYRGDEGNISEAFNDTKDNTFFNWTVSVEEGTTPAAIPGAVPVPYKNVTVQTNYTEIDARGNPAISRTVRLSNIVPYPLIHIASEREFFTIAQSHNYEAPNTSIACASGTGCNWHDITDTGGVLDFDFKVRKDLIVMYNLAISYDTANPPAVDQTVYTRCRLDNGGTQGIITRTPIMTQLFINNILEIANVPAGPHSIHIQWSEDSGSTVWLRGYDITVIAVERTN